MEQETYEVENRWRNKYMNLGRELGEIINSQQAQEGVMAPKKVKGQKMALKSLVNVLNNLVAQLITLEKR